MPLPQPGVDNRRAELLGDIIKNRKEQLAGELKEAGADPEALKELTTEPVQDDPKRPADIPLEEWMGLSDEDKSNAIKAAETGAAEAAASTVATGETEEAKAAREAAEKKAADEAAVAAAARAGKKIKIKVDGQEQEVDEDAVLQAGIKAMQKETAADKRLEEAARLKKEAEAALAAARAPAQDLNQDGRTQPAKAGASTVEQLTDQDYLETVKKVQYGTPEEASAALKSLVSKAATSGQTEELTMAHVAEMLDFREAMSWAQDEFKDILGDPKLKALFSGEEKRMRAAGDNRPYREVYEEIGNGLRGWRDGFKAPAAPLPKNSKDARQERKATIVTIPQAAARQPAPTPTKEPTQSEIIEKIRAQRHQA